MLYLFEISTLNLGVSTLGELHGLLFQLEFTDVNNSSQTVTAMESFNRFVDIFESLESMSDKWVNIKFFSHYALNKFWDLSS